MHAFHNSLILVCITCIPHIPKLQVGNNTTYMINLGNFSHYSFIFLFSPSMQPQGRGFDLQPTENFGFSLQPVANLLRAGDEQYRSSGTEDEDTPPPDSLRSIKSIARARKSAGVERVKTSVDKKAPAKKSKIPKEMSARKGMGSIKGGGAQTAKTKGKLAAGTPDKKQNRSAAGTSDKKKNRSAVGTPDKGRFSWKHPSPSSPPSWSPTPTLRSSKHKVFNLDNSFSIICLHSLSFTMF